MSQVCDLTDKTEQPEASGRDQSRLNLARKEVRAERLGTDGVPRDED